MSVILGLNAFHGDSSACLMIDGEVKVAIEEERIRRIKHWAGFPLLSIKECLEFANKKIEDVDIIAINSRPNSNLTKKIWYSISHIDTLSHSFERLLAKKEIKPLAWYFDKYFTIDMIPDFMIEYSIGEVMSNFL